MPHGDRLIAFAETVLGEDETSLVQARDAAPGTSVQSLNFHDGLLELTLNAPDAASLDHLSQQLRSGGWRADLVGGNTVGSAYQGRVQIHAQGP